MNHLLQGPRKMLAVAAAVGLAVVLAISMMREPPVAPDPPAEIVQEPDPDPGVGPREDATEDAAERPDPAAHPSFDLVRVSPDGAAVVAGRAEPGARVRIVADDREVATAEAGADGTFVAIFDTKPSSEPRALTLDAETADGGREVSDEAVVLLPAPPEAAADNDAETSRQTDDFAPSSANAAGTADQPEPETEPEVAATAILRPDGVQAVPTAPASLDGRVTLASISYTEDGDVTLAGSGTAGAALRAYVDGTLAREVAVGADGTWSLELDDVAEGRYQLRMDQLAPDGTVASRVVTPFQRDFPALPPPRPGSGGPGVRITVQPGATLWTIARVHYGSGVRYTQIFTANRDLIRDPDLIYPGQVLALPGGPEDG